MFFRSVLFSRVDIYHISADALQLFATHFLGFLIIRDIFLRRKIFMLRRFLRNNPTTRRIYLRYNICVFVATRRNILRYYIISVAAMRRKISKRGLYGIYNSFTYFNPTHHEN